MSREDLRFLQIVEELWKNPSTCTSARDVQVESGLGQHNTPTLLKAVVRLAVKLTSSVRTEGESMYQTN